ncbi:hypothetical protein [Bradyrhizobium elkanii]|uniref:hypothetical protein n=1 Tax=Bradyrhizobium elkanii TaxID=29448 RepID=UPI0008415AA1|nr:hypothetical protein [Bradyrhizobium elkanii]ODM71704.1 hypothetical protein A6X20_07115 [Bradyrhizobium elkanii]ODM79077.1 hypothetical protein A6452_28700 [Bradyrhizobium elkanii]
MSIVVVDRAPNASLEPALLYVVWIETNLGEEPDTDWWWNSEPQPLGDALYESAECKRAGFPSVVLPEGTSPRPDGRFYPDEGDA